MPFHESLEGYDVRATEGDYLFAGGDSDRDYATLVTAAQGLPVRTVIAARDRAWMTGLHIGPNVAVGAVSHSEFRSLMAAALIVVVPMRHGLLRSGGQQTYLNAMALGKAVVVCDHPGAADYITHGKDGLIVPPGDPDALRSALGWLLANPKEIARLGRSARETAAGYTTEATMRQVAELALKAAGQQRSAQGMRGSQWLRQRHSNV